MRAGIDVHRAVTQFYRSKPEWLDRLSPCSREGVAALLNDLRGRTSIVELAKASGSSRFAVSRWLKAEAEPKLPEFLLMIEKSSLRLLDFLAQFTDPAKLPSVARAWSRLEAARRAAYDVPWSQAVLRALELTDYQGLPRHQPGWIAARLGIAAEEEQRCLRLLAQTGQIRIHDGRWTPREVLAIDTRRDAEAELQVKRWWTELALERQGARADAVFSYNVFAVSERDLSRITELYRAYFRQVRGIIAQSEPSERVALMSVQLLPLDRRSAGGA